MTTPLAQELVSAGMPWQQAMLLNNAGGGGGGGGFGVSTFIIPGVWWDIRDFGDISSGNITSALQNCLTTVGAGNQLKTVLIPQVIGIDTMTQDAISIPDPTPANDPGWTFIYACKRIQFTSTMSVPAATTIRGDFGTGRRGNGIGARGPSGAHIVGDSIAAGNAVILQSRVGSCSYENLTIECGGGASYGLKVFRSAGVMLRNCDFGGCSNSTGGHAAFAGQQPGLLIDGSFWIQSYDSKFAAGDGSSPSYINRSIEDPTSDVGVGLFTFYNTSLAGGGVKLGPATYGPTGGNCHFDGIVCENLWAGASLFNIDATGNAWNDISVNQAEIADAGGTVYMLKVTGTPSGIKFYNCGVVSIDPSSTGQTTGLYIFGAGIGGGGGDNFTPIPTYNIAYGREWLDMIDARLVAAPRAPQWTIGQVRNVNQDGTSWVLHGGASKTTGQLAPDGTLNAIKISGATFADGYDLYQTTINPVSVGDWFIVGCWVQSVSGSSIGGNSRTLALDLIYPASGTGTLSADSNHIAQNDAGIIDGAWKWCCQAFKVVALGQAAGSTDVHINASVNTAAFVYFNPCMQYIPVSTGLSDGDVMNYTRSLKGGWGPQSNASGAGQVGILDHQSLKGGGLLPALTFGTLPASPIAGMTRYITNSNTATWGAPAAAGGTNKVMVWYNGTNWTVVGA